MENNLNLQLVEFCGESAANFISKQITVEKQIQYLQEEKRQLENELRQSFSVNLSVSDVLIATIAGVVCGSMSGLFKSFIPQHGSLKHKHSTTRTGIDYKVPKPEGMKGSIQGLHRQIGPGHDLGRFQEALDLMSGKKTDFPLWGKSISEQMGSNLHPINMNVEDFINRGGFKIPNDPKAELMNHLLIDFFTKTSLPLPFTSYIADNSQAMAKIMLGMYGSGLNLKNLVGNVSSIAMLQLITNSYVFLFKSAKDVNLYERLHDLKGIDEFADLFNELCSKNKYLKKTKEFDVFQAIAHGSSFLVDAIITTASKNYAGLFALDYGILVKFSIDVIKYVKKSTDIYSDTLNKISHMDEDVLILESLWYEKFKGEMLSLAAKDNFIEIFNPQLIMEKHNQIIQKLEYGQEKRKTMLKELQGWDIDEEN